MIEDVFCKIIKGEIGADRVDEGKSWIAINDIHPVTPVHVLIIPKKHGSIQDYKDEESGYLGELMAGANKVAKKLGLDKTGYRLVVNYGEDSEAHVLDHLHVHLLGGKKLGSKIVK